MLELCRQFVEPKLAKLLFQAFHQLSLSITEVFLSHFPNKFISNGLFHSLPYHTNKRLSIMYYCMSLNPVVKKIEIYNFNQWGINRSREVKHLHFRLPLKSKLIETKLWIISIYWRQSTQLKPHQQSSYQWIVVVYADEYRTEFELLNVDH